MLAFEDTGKKQRQFQCFVCGKNFKTLQEMSDHILECHEEGREYIKCPTCNYCVRDLKTHYKIKHPNRLMPKGMQNKVAVWHDFKTGVKKTKKPTFRSGEFISNKNGGREIHYRSGMECEFLECLENDHDVAAFAAEPFKIPYYWNGKWHNYVVDLRINYINNTVEIWEIKPATQTQIEQNKAKWAAANNYCQNLGWEFIVMTEVGLGKLKTKLKRQV